MAPVATLAEKERERERGGKLIEGAQTPWAFCKAGRGKKVSHVLQGEINCPDKVYQIIIIFLLEQKHFQAQIALGGKKKKPRSQSPGTKYPNARKHLACVT